MQAIQGAERVDGGLPFATERRSNTSDCRDEGDNSERW